MKRELDYFFIDDACGGSQDWFTDPMMKLGGCAAATACDSCIYFDLHRPDLKQGDISFCPIPARQMRREEYLSFSRVMKPYLRPRMNGIDRLEIYMDGLNDYFRDRGIRTVSMDALPGETGEEEAKRIVRAQLEEGFPLPCLILKHKNPALRDYVWHWFLLIGYEMSGERFLVKAATYGEARWLDFDALWDTGESRRGGLILYRKAESEG